MVPSGSGADAIGVKVSARASPAIASVAARPAIPIILTLLIMALIPPTRGAGRIASPRDDTFAGIRTIKGAHPPWMRLLSLVPYLLRRENAGNNVRSEGTGCADGW